MNEFQEKLKSKMDFYAHFIYRLTLSFPKHEIYGITSQIRRSSLSIILNYIEGFARKKKAVKANFWEISYGSLKEYKYLLDFCYEEKLIDSNDYAKASNVAEEIGAMLYRLMVSLKD